MLRSLPWQTPYSAAVEQECNRVLLFITLDGITWFFRLGPFHLFSLVLRARRRQHTPGRWPVRA